MGLNWLLRFTLLLVFVSSAQSQEDDCAFTFLPGYRSIPKQAYVLYEMRERNKTSFPQGGAIHHFAIKKNNAHTNPGIAEPFFDAIRIAPKWCEKFQVTGVENRFLSIPDLARLNARILELQQGDDPDAPWVTAFTYEKTTFGGLASVEVGRNWARRRYTVSTSNPDYFSHDYRNHGLFGYLLLPKRVVDVTSEWAAFLVHLENSKRLFSEWKFQEEVRNHLRSVSSSLDLMTEHSFVTILESPADAEESLAELFWSFGSFPPRSYLAGKQTDLQGKAMMTELRSTLSRQGKRVFDRELRDFVRSKALTKSEAKRLSDEVFQKVRQNSR